MIWYGLWKKEADVITDRLPYELLKRDGTPAYEHRVRYQQPLGRRKATDPEIDDLIALVREANTSWFNFFCTFGIALIPALPLLLASDMRLFAALYAGICEGILAVYFATQLRAFWPAMLQGMAEECLGRLVSSNPLLALFMTGIELGQLVDGINTLLLMKVWPPWHFEYQWCFRTHKVGAAKYAPPIDISELVRVINSHARRRRRWFVVKPTDIFWGPEPDYAKRFFNDPARFLLNVRTITGFHPDAVFDLGEFELVKHATPLEFNREPTFFDRLARSVFEYFGRLPVEKFPVMIYFNNHEIFNGQLDSWFESILYVSSGFKLWPFTTLYAPLPKYEKPRHLSPYLANYREDSYKWFKRKVKRRLKKLRLWHDDYLKDFRRELNRVRPPTRARSKGFMNELFTYGWYFLRSVIITEGDFEVHGGPLAMIVKRGAVGGLNIFGIATTYPHSMVRVIKLHGHDVAPRVTIIDRYLRYMGFPAFYVGIDHPDRLIGGWLVVVYSGEAGASPTLLWDITVHEGHMGAVGAQVAPVVRHSGGALFGKNEGAVAIWYVEFDIFARGNNNAYRSDMAWWKNFAFKEFVIDGSIKKEVERIVKRVSSEIRKELGKFVLKAACLLAYTMLAPVAAMMGSAFYVNMYGYVPFLRYVKFALPTFGDLLGWEMTVRPWELIPGWGPESLDAVVLPAPTAPIAIAMGVPTEPYIVLDPFGTAHGLTLGEIMAEWLVDIGNIARVFGLEPGLAISKMVEVENYVGKKVKELFGQRLMPAFPSANGTSRRLYDNLMMVCTAVGHTWYDMYIELLDKITEKLWRCAQGTVDGSKIAGGYHRDHQYFTYGELVKANLASLICFSVSLVAEMYKKAWKVANDIILEWVARARPGRYPIRIRPKSLHDLISACSNSPVEAVWHARGIAVARTMELQHSLLEAWQRGELHE